MWAWPDLQLTEYERKFVRIYKNGDKPGVLRRTYIRTLNDTANINQNLPIIRLSDQLQISRRSRIFGLTFTGNLDSWRLSIANASGTQYTTKTPRTQRDPVVSSMVPSIQNNANSLGGLTPPIGVAVSPGIGPNVEVTPLWRSQFQLAPLIIDPNWLLMPNETLIFTGTPIPISYQVGEEEVTQPLILNIAIHVWEFPGMGRATKEIREVV